MHLIGVPLMSFRNNMRLGLINTISKGTHNTSGSRQRVLSQSRRSERSNTSLESQADLNSLRVSMTKTNDAEICRVIGKLSPQSNGRNVVLSPASVRQRRFNKRSLNSPGMNLITPGFSTGVQGFGRLPTSGLRKSPESSRIKIKFSDAPIADPKVMPEGLSVLGDSSFDLGKDLPAGPRRNLEQIDQFNSQRPHTNFYGSKGTIAERKSMQDFNKKTSLGSLTGESSDQDTQERPRMRAKSADTEYDPT